MRDETGYQERFSMAAGSGYVCPDRAENPDELEMNAGMHPARKNRYEPRDGRAVAQRDDRTGSSREDVRNYGQFLP